MKKILGIGIVLAALIVLQIYLWCVQAGPLAQTAFIRVEKGTSLLFDGNYPPKKPIRDKIALKNIPVRKGERIFFLGGVNAYGGRIDLHDLEIALEPGTKGK